MQDFKAHTGRHGEGAPARLPAPALFGALPALAASALLALFALFAAQAGAHASAHAAAALDEPRSAADRVFDRIHSVARPDDDSGLRDYGLLSNGGELLTHGPDRGAALALPDDDVESPAGGRTPARTRPGALPRSCRSESRGDSKSRGKPKTRRKARRPVKRRRSKRGRSAADCRKAKARTPKRRRSRSAPARASQSVSLPLLAPALPAARLSCPPAGTTNLYEVIYYVPSSRSAGANLESLKSETIAAADLLSAEAFAEGRAFRALNVQADSGCRPVIETVNGTQSATDFGSVSGDLSSNFGKSRTDRKYLVFVEGGANCGEASMYWDESKSYYNSHNVNTGYSQIGPSCWSDGGRTVLHEIAHNLSAVQLGAPNNNTLGPVPPFSNSRWHCWTESDVMCYSESGGRATQTVCSDREWLDCDHDDYFNPSPPSGGYLAGHFNMATDSSWVGASDATPPAVNPDLYVRDTSPPDAGRPLPPGIGPDIQNFYRVELKAAARDNWELAGFRFGRSQRLAWTGVGECPLDTGSNYGGPTNTLDADASGNRTRVVTVEGSFGMTRAGCYKLTVSVTDRSGFQVSTAKVARIATPQDLVIETGKSLLPSLP